MGAQVEQLRRRVAELEELVADRERFRVFFEHAPDAVYLHDKDGAFVDGNPAAEALIGYRKEELIGRSFLEMQLLPPEDLPAAALILTRNLRGENTGPDELNLVRKDGTQVPIEVITFPVELDDGLLVVGFARETSERKRLEEQLRQANKLEAVGKLAGGLAHDFNNLLMAITGYAELLQHKLDTDDPRQNAVDEILKAGERGAALTRQLLAFSRDQPLRHQPVDLNLLVSDTVKMLRPMVPENIDVDVELESDVGHVHGDAAQLTGVLVNLSMNGVDAMTGGGKLAIATGRADRETGVDGSIVEPGGYAVVSVEDTGTGMDEATVERIFDPFFTTKEPGKGTGMGLSTAYGVVRQHTGEITVTSTAGEGTTFRVYLPLSGKQAAEVAPPPAERDSAEAGEVVLVVEDEIQVRTVVREILERRGYEVLLAADGDQAARALEQHGERVALLLTDVVMPGTSGPDLHAWAVERHPDLKVLFMTGYADPERATGPAESLRPLIRKPFGNEELAAAVRRALEA